MLQRREKEALGAASSTVEPARKLQRVLGKKTLENEILKQALEYAAEKVECALALAARRRPVKTLCRVLGVGAPAHSRPSPSCRWLA